MNDPKKVLYYVFTAVGITAFVGAFILFGMMYLMEKFDVAESSEGGDIWATNLFGKSLQELVAEQMDGKLTAMPETLQGKVQRSLQKISNEGKDYFICIIL